MQIVASAMQATLASTTAAADQTILIAQAAQRHHRYSSVRPVKAATSVVVAIKIARLTYVAIKVHAA